MTRGRSQPPAEIHLSADTIWRPDAKGVESLYYGGPSNRERPFHFTHMMTLLCHDIVERTPAFEHIDPERILVTYVACRSRRAHGIVARLTPLRFLGGKETEPRDGWVYRLQRIFVGPIEMDYVMTFYMPRFIHQTFDEKLITIFHELYHVSPETIGDIRRLGPGRSGHGGSLRGYDREMAILAKAYLKGKPNPEKFDFLRSSFLELFGHHRDIVGLRIPTPKKIPVSKV